MKFILTFLFVCLAIGVKANQYSDRLVGSADHNSKHNCQPIGNLNPQMNLTITVVTGSLAKTEIVAAYFNIFDFLTIKDENILDLKLKGTVAQFSQVFNTTFIQYQCPNSTNKFVQYATSSEVYIPKSVQSNIVGILGLETVITHRAFFRRRPSTHQKPSTTYSYFTGNEAAQVYGVPSGTGSGVKVGIVTLGGYFLQSDLQTYFTNNGLGTAPTIKVAYVDGATQDTTDTGSATENYLDIENVATVVPQATITIYFSTQTTTNGFYDVLKMALMNNNVVSCSWGSDESGNPASTFQMFQTLFSTYSNVPAFMATGDTGSYVTRSSSVGGAGFPASCPNAID